ncbi:hypothetical protein GGP46_002219 [Salinibacter ruber]|nr:hypothetical protein [Salinibacter ruber]
MVTVEIALHFRAPPLALSFQFLSRTMEPTTPNGGPTPW